VQFAPPHPLALEALAHRLHHVARPLLLHGARSAIEERADPVLVGGAGAKPSPSQKRADDDHGDGEGSGDSHGKGPEGAGTPLE
jgi:hypothetical protein